MQDPMYKYSTSNIFHPISSTKRKIGEWKVYFFYKLLKNHWRLLHFCWLLVPTVTLLISCTFSFHSICYGAHWSHTFRFCVVSHANIKISHNSWGDGKIMIMYVIAKWKNFAYILHRFCTHTITNPRIVEWICTSKYILALASNKIE